MQGRDWLAIEETPQHIGAHHGFKKRESDRGCKFGAPAKEGLSDTFVRGRIGQSVFAGVLRDEGKGTESQQGDDTHCNKGGVNTIGMGKEAG